MKLLKTAYKFWIWISRRQKPGWKIINTQYLDSQHWCASVGEHVQHIPKTWMKCYGGTDDIDEDGSSGRTGKRQLKLISVGFAPVKKLNQVAEVVANFFQARKFELFSQF
ncbi:Hypothetical predicted protein [Olea europaea subsp. europaea]|uniref:Uncharacterized protein n=1 Tax=Olea europaea subsp. europaea TaxID=158383 RepID=A0A8S0T2N1_OLEEU|nr:Hypothetical predicted protein [Olea europaea subsp. europaea]